MTSAIPVHVALVDESGEIGLPALQQYAGALSEQILRDVAPIWHVNASIGAYQAAPKNTWAVKIQTQLDEPGALGYHSDDHNQPYALVQYTGSWDVTVSHEVLEMIVDPWGNRMHSGRLPIGLEQDFAQFGLTRNTSLVHYLLEVCDPPEDESFGYEVGSYKVSDFIRPIWYSNVDHGSRSGFSFNGGCTHPREIANGGYASFANDAGEWYQATNFGSLQVQDLGKFDNAEWSSIREFTDHHARVARGSEMT